MPSSIPIPRSGQYFSIPMGSVTAIVGTNGTGKTTMMQAELGLLPLENGSIRVLGRPAGDANHLIGYVPQSYTSDIESNLTAEQSVLLGLTGTRFGIHRVSREEKAKAREALDFVGIADRAAYRLSELSGGQRQRVAIAQALVGSCSCSTNRWPTWIWPASAPWWMCWPSSTANWA